MSAGFGVEMYCLDRMRTGKYVRGRAALAQAIYRRLITPRGTLQGGDEEQIYGLDLAGFIGRTALPVVIATLPGVIAAELSPEKDDRISSVAVDVTVDAPSNGLVTFTIVIRVVSADEEDEFSLTLAASATSVELLGVAA